MQDLRVEDRKRHDYYRRRFRLLTEKYGQNIQSQVAELIKCKANQLINENIESLANLTRNETQTHLFNSEKRLAKITNEHISDLDEINLLSGMVKTQVNVTGIETKECEGCGKIINGRKYTAIYCSEECRIKSKNRRRDLRLPLKRLAERQKEMATLFDINPYIELSGEQLRIIERYSIEIE